ncbi:MAG: 3-phosphoshikimate 1-carboxyvinyltransferase [Deferribacteres bacterium]|nr:3-phosphoshikimate 1-carboxyvinyltransferase [candidate division KSB1 bacterium]MCB9501819.1 3-phosphoshikimate 1-carboxyvinyltransferase [Deferribacteres bacterium]
MKLTKASRLYGEVTLPGDKSISQRALLFAALANGTSTISGLSNADDVNSMASCLRQLGVQIKSEGGKIIVEGVGLYGLRQPKVELDCGNSGTTMRLLAGVLAGQPFSSVLVGDASLSRRPMRRIIDPLVAMGAKIEASKAETAPLKIAGRQLQGISYELPVASAQVKSAVLLAGLFADGETTVIEPVETRDHTEIMLNAMGMDVWKEIDTIHVSRGQLKAGNLLVPGDISAASFFIVAGLIVPESQITIKNVGINPTRSYLLGLLQRNGAVIKIANERKSNGEPVADLEIKSSVVNGFTVKGREIPLLIDEIPILAILATQSAGTTLFRNAKELRVKESDRIEAVAENLRKMGVVVTTYEDGLEITGKQELKGAMIETYHDHRIAMAFAVAALVAEGETILEDANLATVSFPDFYKNIKSISA